MSTEETPINAATPLYSAEVNETEPRRLNHKMTEEEIMPLIHRSKTFSNCAKAAGDITVPISVNNPLNYERRLSVFPNSDFGELYNRIDSLQALRPFRLIGKIGRLINWQKYYIDENKLDKIKNGEVKEFYEEQNEMINRYQDMDLLLDTGVQIEMIQNYADNTSSENNSEEENAHLIDEIIGPTSAIPSNTHANDETPLTVPKSIKMTHTSSSGTHRHINISAAPGNIDLEGAKILGSGDHGKSKIVIFAIYFNFALNFILLLGKFVVVYFSNSLSLIASLVDSSLDFLSTMIIFVANKFAMKKSSRFPVGRKQLEPIGVMIFSVIMILSFSQVLIESVKELFSKDNDHELAKLSNISIIIMVVTISSKLIAYFLCKHVKNSSIQALVEDAKTDIVFNVFSLIFPVIGLIFQIWWIDALGASLLCLYVMLQWITITFEHINHLSGSHASKEEYQQVLYLIVRFSDEISKIKNFRMYHIGDLINVEVDIVLKNIDMNLRDAHDLGESLQYAIETLPYVNRCFVHMDYRVRNYVGHLE
ncbi:hypothetical protein DAPK24_037670 [Pichia kluyveri]|uniref:Cation efflux protein transmembrane domain-containing protein n=1 Tax=Pichia kluyveri TaxID=36015 RepID=A0AAV5R7C2_PICKL|nr:hypothetical protein DAPK24_037670 [Pichia kluyveri]